MTDQRASPIRMRGFGSVQSEIGARNCSRDRLHRLRSQSVAQVRRRPHRATAVSSRQTSRRWRRSFRRSIWTRRTHFLRRFVSGRRRGSRSISRRRRRRRQLTTHHCRQFRINIVSYQQRCVRIQIVPTYACVYLRCQNPAPLPSDFLPLTACRTFPLRPASSDNLPTPSGTLLPNSRSEVSPKFLHRRPRKA